MRERWDAGVDRARVLTTRTLAWFPVRVWRHFLRHNGFLLAAGISYQSLFAIFAALSLGAAIVGIWLGASSRAIDGLIRLVNGYIPNLISDHGLVTPKAVETVASEATGLLSIAGLIAGGILVWTAIGFVTYTRRAVRTIFGLPFDVRAYVILKARDLLAAVVFGFALLVGAALGQLAAGAIDLVLTSLGFDRGSFWVAFTARAISLVVAFWVNSFALASLFRFLIGSSLGWRAVWPGALLGGLALAVIQLGAGLLLYYTPSNPLLATFTVFIGFLLWFRLVGIVILVAAAWIAVAATDKGLPLVERTEAERLAEERAAVLLAAAVQLRAAKEALEAAPWYRRPAARRAVHAAEGSLADAEAAVTTMPSSTATAPAAPAPGTPVPAKGVGRRR